MAVHHHPEPLKGRPMSRIFVITGSSSGMGEATAARLSAKGHRVIGVDIRGAEVNVDLGTAQGRQDMVAQVRALAPEGIDGVLTCAGLADAARPGLVVAVNYFGTIAAIEGLQPLLRGPGSRCVAVASTAVMISSPEILALEALCLQGDEAQAVEFGQQHGMLCAYPASKRALTRWARREAIKPEWAGSGKLLNIVAPGTVKTPMIAQALADPEQAAMIRQHSLIAVDDYAEAPAVAELMEFLLTFEGNFTVGHVFYIDGGSEVMTRPDVF
jgi:NAD(P)-dependent dehydrogenase (short-subunit alcohol dehydrogenase family)